jgi:hypothetical protein
LIASSAAVADVLVHRWAARQQWRRPAPGRLSRTTQTDTRLPCLCGGPFAAESYGRVGCRGRAAEHPVYEAALLEERDRYMAARLKALAKGEAGVAPAFVRVETQGELRFMRYRAMPQGFTGEGGKPPASIVAVVGLAHVAGICAEWDQ